MSTNTTERRRDMTMLEIAGKLGRLCPGLGARDARMLLDRVVALLDAGEPSGSVLARLNMPAQAPVRSVDLYDDEPVPPAKSTVHALVPTSHATVPVAPPVSWHEHGGVTYRRARCNGCGDEFEVAKRSTPGRYPSRCEPCR
jgi:hypothetical protein